jgi:hypothetical protein
VTPVTQAEQTILSRTRQESHREPIKHLFGLQSRRAAKRRELESDQSLSDIGRRERESEFAKSLIPNLVELTKPLRRAKADAAAARAKIKLPEIDKTDLVGELRRREIRDYVRGLPLGERMKAVDSLDGDQLVAILDAPAMLVSTGSPDRGADGLAFVAAQIVENDDVASLQHGDEDLLDIKTEQLAVDRTIDDPW